MALGYNWTTVREVVVQKGAATVTFRINAKLNRQVTADNYSVVDTQLTSSIVNNLAGSGYSFSLSGANTISGDTVWTFENETILTGQLPNVYHESDGKKTLNISARVYNRYWGIDTTFSGNVELPTIPRASQPSCVTHPNTTKNVGAIGGKITIYTNRKSTAFTHTIRYKWYNKSGNIATGIGDSCQWTIPNDFTNDIPNDTSGKGTIYADTYSGSTLVGTNSVEFEANVTDANPTFSNFTFEDTNTKTTALTGNSQYNVNGYSTIKATISTTNKAVANKGASMSLYRLTIGDKKAQVNYSSSAAVTLSISKAPNGTYNVYAEDSRRNTTLVTKFATKELAYTDITINKQTTTLMRSDNNVGNEVTLTLKGTVWNQSFGKVTNSIKSVTYRYKKTESSSWTNGSTAIKPTVSSNGSYSFTGYITTKETTWDIGSSYNVQITVNDELSSASVDLILNSAVPTLSLDKNGVGVMCSYNTSLGGQLQVGGKTIDSMINTIVNPIKSSSLTYKILWENNGSPVETDKITITLNSSDYDLIIWFAHQTIDIVDTDVFAICSKGKNANLASIFYPDARIERTLLRTNDTTYTTNPCHLNGTVDNHFFIPYKAIGIKLGNS